MTARMPLLRTACSITIAAAVTLFAPSAGAADGKQEPDYAALTAAATDRVIVPAYEKLAAAMALLAAVTRDACSDPASAPGKVRSAFAAAMDAWQQAQPISFGPVADGSRASRIEYWPDKRGTGQRQVRRALSARDPALVAPGGLEGKSVALQGLATYEAIMFGDVPGNYACAFASAIAAFQKDLTASVRDDWTKPGGFAETMRTAANGNAKFRDAKETATEILKAAAGTVDAVIQQKLEPPLGESMSDAAPNKAENWRTGLSLADIVGNLRTLEALFTCRDGLRDQLTRVGAGPLGDGMVRSVEKAIALARAVPMPLAKAVADPGARPKVEELLEAVRGLRVLIRNPVADELHIVVGFNALDGD